jgi:hypothetical protein
MEIVFELLFAILQFLCEAGVQILFEGLFELGVHESKKSKRRPKPLSPFLAAVFYIFAGALAGWLSIIFFPTLFISSYNAQIIGLIVTPILAGGFMVLIGAWRHKHGQELIRLDKFAYGFLFALSMALVRFWLAQT